MGNHGNPFVDSVAVPSGVDCHRGNGTTCLKDDGHLTNPLIVTAATDFIHRQAAAKERFFLYVPFHLIHAPNEVPGNFLSSYPPTEPSINITSSICEEGKPWSKYCANGEAQHCAHYIKLQKDGAHYCCERCRLRALGEWDNNPPPLSDDPVAHHAIRVDADGYSTGF